MPVYKEKSTGKWFARLNYTDASGIHRSYKSKRFDTKAEASEHLAQMVVDKKQAPSRITFNDIFQEYVSEQLSKVKPTTHSHYQALYDHIKDDLGEVAIERLTIPRYKAFKEYLNNRIIKQKNTPDGLKIVYMSTSRKNRCHRFVKTLIKLAYDNYGIINNVPDRVGGFRDPINLQPEEEEIKIINLSDFNLLIDQVDDCVYKTLFMVLFFEGLRIGEALALNWHDIDFDKGILHINKTYTSKLNKSYKGASTLITRPKTRSSIRNIPIENRTAEALKMLQDYYSGFPAYSDDWFVFGGFKPLSETTITVKKDQALAAAGLPRITIHQFRHSCASYLFDKGIKPTVVQKYLGHSKLSTTMNIYTHLYPEDLMKVHEI